MRPKPPRLFTTEEWAAMSEDQREAVWNRRRAEVEAARKEHAARKRLNDRLTVERFGRDRGR